MYNIYKNQEFPIDAQNLALESIKQIYNIIKQKDYKNIYDNYSISHLENIEYKIEQFLDIN